MRIWAEDVYSLPQGYDHKCGGYERLCHADPELDMNDHKLDHKLFMNKLVIICVDIHENTRNKRLLKGAAGAY